MMNKEMIENAYGSIEIPSGMEKRLQEKLEKALGEPLREKRLGSCQASCMSPAQRARQSRACTVWAWASGMASSLGQGRERRGRREGPAYRQGPVGSEGS